nr:M56 family metallopeptidase [Chiayiivirga flava]
MRADAAPTAVAPPDLPLRLAAADASVAAGQPAPTATRDAPRRVAAQLAGGVIAVWLAGMTAAALVLLRQLVALRALRRHTRRTARAAALSLQHAARALAERFGVAAPDLFVDDTVASPMLLCTRRLLLAPWCERAAPQQQYALLAHEFAHLQRGDLRWRIAHRIALLPLWFHPLAHVACRRLDALAEDACDARATACVGDGRALAECLAACLRSPPRRAPRHNALAVAMAGERGAVVRRVHRLLENTMPTEPLPAYRLRLAVALGLAVLVLLPGIAITTQAAGSRTSTNVQIDSDDGRERLSYTSKRAGHALSVKMDGRIEFADDESDVVAMDDDAGLSIEETVDGVTREISFDSKGGTIERDYRVDDDAHALDAEGRAWLARTLPAVFRETGIHAQARGTRLLAAGGPDALLDEIDKIASDHARRRYLDVLFGNARLDDAQLDRAVAQAATIESDFELRHALQAAFTTQTLSDAALAALLRAGSAIESDFESAELLVALGASHRPLDGNALAAWTQMRGNIDSAFEQRRVLEALLDGNAGPAELALVLDGARGIDGDFEKGQVLERSAPLLRGAPDAIAAYLRAADTIDGSFERSQALLALLQHETLDVTGATAALDTIAGIDGDFEMARTLEALAQVMPSDATVIARYRAVAADLGDFERKSAEAALGRTVRVY